MKNRIETASMVLVTSRLSLSIFLLISVSIHLANPTGTGLALALITVAVVVLLKGAGDFLEKMKARAPRQGADTLDYQWRTMTYHHNGEDTDSSVMLELRGDEADRFVRDYSERNTR